MGHSESTRIDQELAGLQTDVLQLQGGLVFLGANDSSFSIDLGASVDSGDVTIDDSAIASSGALLAGTGSMYGTSFEVSGLDAGLYEIFVSFQWGTGISEEALTQRFTLDCSGPTVLYAPRVTIAAGDADENGVNVAYPIVLRGWVQAASGDDLECNVNKRIIDIARTGAGILYNDINGPVVARLELVTPD